MDKSLRTMIDNMPEKIGKSLDDWKTLLQEKTFSKHSEGVKYLKTEHNVTHGFANTFATRSKEEDSLKEDLKVAQYKGKEALVLLYDELISFIKTIGPDVTITPKKGVLVLFGKVNLF